jgi:hypothetical protein
MRRHTDRFVVMALVGLCLSALADRSLADPPTGDTCASAVHVEGPWANGDLGPCTNDYDPAVPGPSCTGLAAPGKDFVFQVELNCTTGLSVDLAPSGFDGALYVVTDCADITGSCVAGSDQAGVGANEWVEIWFPMTRTYYIIVDARDVDAGGVFSLAFSWLSVDIFLGACCFPDGHCEIQDLALCGPAGGETLGPCTTCDPNPCGPTPALEATWGTIKMRYR